mgnify:CR=1 FL=1
MSTTPATTGFLAEMAHASRMRVRRLAARTTRAALERRARAAPPPLPLRVSPTGFELVAEVKFASPSAGALVRSPSAARAAGQARRYAAAGAAALSVLTEPSRFAGTLAHLRAAAAAVSVPVMRKDFLVDPLQVLEARAAGASGVLLVLRMLDEAALAALLDEAGDLGLFVLLEAFDEADLGHAARALDARRGQALLVGVNARDLASLAVDPERHRALAAALPRTVPCVAESGLASPSDVHGAARAGYAMALVGSALMRAPDPGARLAELLAAGRAGVAQRRSMP